MARATLAPVIGSPASWSQKIVWRYSSSATVASARAMIVSGSRKRPHPPLGERHELARGRGQAGGAAGDEREGLVDRGVEPRRLELALARHQRPQRDRVAQAAGGKVERR